MYRLRRPHRSLITVERRSGNVGNSNPTPLFTLTPYSTVTVWLYHHVSCQWRITTSKMEQTSKISSQVVLQYADDIVLPVRVRAPRAIPRLRQICDEYTNVHSIILNGKSVNAWLQHPRDVET